MRRLLSTYLFISRKVTPELLDHIAAAGFESVELFCSRSHFDYTSRPEIQAMAAALDTHRLSLASLHAPTNRDLSATRRFQEVVISPDGKLLFAANGPSNDVSVVDLATNKEVTRVKAGSSPWGLAVVPKSM